MIDIKKTFDKEIQKRKQIEEIFRESCKRQILRAKDWEIEILEDEVKKWRLNRR